MPSVNLRHQCKRGLEFLRDVFRSPEKKPGSAIKLSDMAYFFPFIKPLLRLYLLGIGLTVMVTSLGSVLPLAGKFFVDFVVEKSGTSEAGKLLGPLYPDTVTPGMLAHLGSVNFLILTLLVISIVVSVLGIVRAFVMRKVEQELTYNIQTELFNRVLRFPMSYLKNRQTGYLMSRISGDVGAVTALLNQVASQSFSNLFTLLFNFSIIFALNAKLSFVLLVIIPVTMIVNNFFSRRYRSISRVELEGNAQVSRDMQEILSGLEVVKLYNTEATEARKISDRIRSLNTIRLKSLLTASLAQFFSSGAQSMLAMLIMWIGAAEIFGGTMTIGDYLAFTAYSATIAASINSLLYLQLSLQPMLASFERLAEMFRVVPETTHKKSDKTSAKLGKVAGDVRFEDVSFSYGEGRKTLDQISFRVAPGEMVALVGMSGGGKTTLINMLLKFYDPDSGDVFLDGHNLKDLDTQSLRNQISVVSQDIFLFNDTIENNIKYGCSQASHEKVEEAAKKAHIHEHILTLPGKYDTVIGEKGSMLSLGQRQRISIARAFLKDVPILVLDEPTSSLDTVTEAMLRDSLKALAEHRTVLVISHRLFVCEMATRILVLSQGKIAEAGTHEELLRNGRLYPEIYSGSQRKTVMAEAVMPVP